MTAEPDIDLAAALKEWRGKIPLRIAAETLGVPKRTLEHVEQGRRFPYPLLLLAAIRTIDLEQANG